MIDLLELFVNSFVTGVAVALGSFIANRAFTSKLDKLIKRMEKRLIVRKAR